MKYFACDCGESYTRGSADAPGIPVPTADPRVAGFQPTKCGRCKTALTERPDPDAKP